MKPSVITMTLKNAKKWLDNLQKQKAKKSLKLYCFLVNG